MSESADMVKRAKEDIEYPQRYIVREDPSLAIAYLDDGTWMTYLELANEGFITKREAMERMVFE